MKTYNFISDAFDEILNIITEITNDGIDPEHVDYIADLLDEDVVITETEKVFVYEYNFSDGSTYKY